MYSKHSNFMGVQTQQRRCGTIEKNTKRAHNGIDCDCVLAVPDLIVLVAGGGGGRRRRGSGDRLGLRCRRLDLVNQPVLSWTFSGRRATNNVCLSRTAATSTRNSGGLPHRFRVGHESMVRGPSLVVEVTTSLGNKSNG